MIKDLTDSKILALGNLDNLTVNGANPETGDFYISEVLPLKKKYQNMPKRLKPLVWTRTWNRYRKMVEAEKKVQRLKVKEGYPQYIRDRNEYSLKHWGVALSKKKAFEINCQTYWKLYIKDGSDVDNLTNNQLDN